MAVAALGFVLSAAHAQAQSCADRPDFAYKVENDLVLALDDGADTRIQLQEGSAVPAAMSVKAGQRTLLTLKRDGQYLVAPGLHSQIVLRWANGQQATIRYTGRCDLNVRGAEPRQAPQGDVTASTPRLFEGVQDVARPFQARGALAQSGRATAPMRSSDSELPFEDFRSSRQAQAARPAIQQPAIAPNAQLASMGVQAVATPSSAVPAPAPTPVPEAPKWDIHLADGTLSKALARWARSVQGADQLPISWEAAKDWPAIAASYRGSFLDAIEQVMKDTERSQYPLHACAYDNILRVLHVSQSCLR